MTTAELSIGTGLELSSAEAAKYVATQGFDWLDVDTDHNAIEIRTTSRMPGAIELTVHIPWKQPENFKRILDAGS